MVLRSLQTRIIFFFVLLLCALQGVALFLMSAANERIAKNQIAQELVVGERVFRRLLEQNSQQLAQAASVLAADFAFREAIATRDEGTIASVLGNHGRRINANVVMLADLDKKLLANSLHTITQQAEFPFPELIGTAQQQGRASDTVLIDGRPYQVVVVPVLAPIPIAWVAMGFVIDDAVALDLQALSGLQVSFLSRSGRGNWTVHASTLPPVSRGELADRLGAERPTVTLPFLDEDYETRLSILHERGDIQIAAVLQRSLKEGLAPFTRLRDTLIALALASIALSVLGSILIARGIAGPINRLAGVARKVRDGDYSQKAETGRTDEIGDFADSFNHMLQGIFERESKILRLAYEDTLTGLPNRAMFIDRLEHAIQSSRQNGEPVVVMMMDLNRFKPINDSLGHPVGDQVLLGVARRLRELLRESETVARFGGDEFAVLLPTGGMPRAKSVVNQMERALATPILTQGQPIDLGASIGIAVFPGYAEDTATLIRHADIAMYVAKRNNASFTTYESDFELGKPSQLSLLGELRSAVEEDQLTLYYQPKVDLRSGASDSVEALVRWVHPKRGFVMPIDFIPFAEQTGYIKAVTRWVLERALSQCGEWHMRGTDVKIAVNISVRDLMSPDLPRVVSELTAKYKVPAQLVCLEITESAVMEDPARAHETLERLHKLGLRLSIDDFGTGHSSLAYIRKLPVKEMKIDRSFVRNMVADKDDAVIVRSTIELGHNMGLKVVAEGVEDHAALMLLTKLGCDEAQGFFIAKPQPPDEYETWLRRRRAVGDKLTESGFIGDKGR
ncbi:MAG: EAL domain-containing protein [Betaproteobacteria bacterium]|nr:EAL domain-containing protein [Betaproteobacteria bacterium]